MKTTEQNSFGAENAVEELIADNVKLLETQIGSDTISTLVDLSREQKLNQKFLNLLSSVCSCNGRAIATNQDSVYATMLKDPQTNEDLFFKMETKIVDGQRKHFVLVKNDSDPDKTDEPRT